MSITELVALIFTFNVITFGNGPVMVPLLQNDLVEERAVLTQDQLLYAFTIARVTPGPANIYVASIGYMLFGAVGAALALLAVMLPGYVMLPLLGVHRRLQAIKAVQGFTRGLTTASVGLIFAATLDIGREILTSLIAWAIFLLTLFLAYGLKWNPIFSLVMASAVGIVLKMWL